MERLEVKAFGPLKDVDIDIKDINIFIGETSSGKSTAAKLISIFNSFEFTREATLTHFKKLLDDFNINFPITSDTEILYSKNSRIVFEIKNQILTNNDPNQTIFSVFSKTFDTLDLIGKDGFTIDNHRIGLLGTQVVLDHPEISLLEKHFENEQIILLLNQIKIFKKNQETRNEESFYNSVIEAGNIFLKIIQEMGLYTSLYIPAERILISMVAESLFSLLKNEVSIATCIKDFGAKFEQARKEEKRVNIDFLGIQYFYEKNENFIKLPDNSTITLERASSGYQSIIPLMIVLQHFLGQPDLLSNCLVIEEPELNLYPTLQKSLIEYIVEKMFYSGNKLILTTYSPYVLTTIDNLIQAYNVAFKQGKHKAEVEQIIPIEHWVNFNKVTCYHFKDGGCRSTLDQETMTIGASNIDDVSIELGKVFDKLIELKYN